MGTHFQNDEKSENSAIHPTGGAVKEPVPMPEIPVPEIPKPVFTKPVIPPPEAPDASGMPDYRKRVILILNALFCIFCFATPFLFGFGRDTVVLIVVGVLALPLGFVQGLWKKLFSARAGFIKLLVLTIVFLAALSSAAYGNAVPGDSAAASAPASVQSSVILRI